MKSLTTETALDILIAWLQDNIDCNQVNHLIPTRVLVKGGEITCKILK
ncbi:DUF957 domain-containing protein [Escherichia coli]|nr:DUF957 domain-containing protein [Escherichia coli]